MFKSYSIKSILIFSICCAPIRGVGNVIPAPLANLINTSNLSNMAAATDPFCLFCITINTIDDAILHEIDDTTTSTLDAVQKNGSCIAQIMQTMQENQQNIDTKLDELAADDAKIFSAIESVDNHVIQTCKAVKLGDNMLNAKMNLLSDQIAACCEELGANDAAIFSAIESLDSDVDNVHTAVTAGTIILGTQIHNLSTQLTDTYIELSENDAKIFSAIEAVDANVDAVGTAVTIGNAILSAQISGLSNQVADCCEELSENDAKIFSMVDIIDANVDDVQAAVIANGIMLQELSENDAKIFSTVEHIDTTLGSIFCAASREREAEIVESSTAHHHVKFIDNNMVNRAGGMLISAPGLYIITEAITIDKGSGIEVIEGYNVTIDLNGFTIAAQAEKVVPLSITQSDLVTVKNGTLSGGQGIVINGVHGVTLEKLTVTYSLNTGIHMSDVHGATIDQCIVRASAQDGVVADTGSTELIMRDTTISDCQGTGLNLQGNGIVLKDIITHHNGGDGAHVANGSDVHCLRMVADNNNGNGITIDSSVERAQVESCRVMGNNGIGCVDNGATLATWMNNLASGNTQDDYHNIKAVLVGKATSFWHNVYGK